jgi:hypothetical protein
MKEEEIINLREKLEQKGEQTVRDGLATSIYNEKKLPHIHQWLQEKEETRCNAHKKETLSVASEANKIAKKNNLVAWAALAVSIIALVISYVK